MDWADTKEQAAFRQEIRDFVSQRFPKRYRPDFTREHSLELEDVPGYNWPADVKSEDPERREAALEWTGALAEKGWVAPHWPKEYGGAGLGVMEYFIFTEEMSRARVPLAGGIGVTLLGPTLIAYGTEEQCRQHLPRIVSGEVVWAQGFSEPGAGSDLASLQTRAFRDGDDYVINGSKIWTSHAQYADWLFALVRTDPQSERHRGMSMLMMDISTPGITVQPITDMRGDEPFNAIFFDNVRVPAANLLGEEGRGWYVAMATLDFERSGVGGTVIYQQLLTDLVDFARSPEGEQYLRDDWRQTVRHELAARYIEIRVLYNLSLRTASVQASGHTPNYEASVAKLFSAETSRRLANTRMSAFGLYGNLWQRERAPMEASYSHGYLDAVSHTILSGSSEIMRNVIATRGLGLPRS